MKDRRKEVKEGERIVRKYIQQPMQQKKRKSNIK
jgi:hypothetical protein